MSVIPIEALSLRRSDAFKTRVMDSIPETFSHQVNGRIQSILRESMIKAVRTEEEVDISLETVVKKALNETKHEGQIFPPPDSEDESGLIAGYISHYLRALHQYTPLPESQALSNRLIQWIGDVKEKNQSEETFRSTFQTVSPLHALQWTLEIDRKTQEMNLKVKVFSHPHVGN